MSYFLRGKCSCGVNAIITLLDYVIGVCLAKIILLLFGQGNRCRPLLPIGWTNSQVLRWHS
jgi:hypothetical protein